eukprot:CAMPEP_0168457652 /NCGR_PEP_ID=MMETSP0228-20121227/51958_1 /TAXON_ID=133427 /ORGANISM="Protoceratium reticulatum, Strain CCCM 535 (=CCMP 1889)" /LENGTH=37 /DNA_ID= /DNA_START= /DNA_END= /DNA_ORIENTATION=
MNGWHTLGLPNASPMAVIPGMNASASDSHARPAQRQH